MLVRILRYNVNQIILQNEANTYLKIDNLSLTINKVEILNNVNLTAKSGQITCILGNNGSGKTSLINVVSGL